MSDEKNGQEKLKEDFLEQYYNWGSKGDTPKIRPRFPGLCGKCQHLEYLSTQYGHAQAKCDSGNATVYMGRRGYLNPDDPVIECTDFWPLGAPTLKQLADQAYFIGEIKKVVGFGNG